MTYPVYKLLKTLLADIAPVFYFIGQYTKGKDNTSYKVPAIYIEVPKDLQTVNNRKVKKARNVTFKIHYISDAPFKNQDNNVQDSAIQAHETIVNQIDKLVNGWVAKDTAERLLSQQLLATGESRTNFTGTSVFSILEFETELYSYHLEG